MNRRDFLRKLAVAAGAAVVIPELVTSTPEPAALPPIKVEGYSTVADAWQKTYTHKTWALGIEVAEREMEDDLYDFYCEMGRNLGRVGAEVKEAEILRLTNPRGIEVINAL